MLNIFIYIKTKQMSILTISGNTLTKKEWDVEDILSTNKNRNTKEELERANWYFFNEKERVKEFYETSYLNLEYSKSL
jgi:hypothetical protein